MHTHPIFTPNLAYPRQMRVILPIIGTNIYSISVVKRLIGFVARFLQQLPPSDHFHIQLKSGHAGH